ncbi:restriction endonuclease subunit S [Burkholderia stagnalis]|uniref:restriction endonuclease subunit S n=1 Tax=Burkholderia stagnalis TaxID=1503054 RepID=UPI00075E69BC|nr:restriction endonuclease subunit S [Burkholderia stagnalis]KVC55640.1 hypothetical protein WS59_06635 [Burkholderia stagnalis]KVN25488.1 hypothetical protein WT10_04685 [Burkholderia stagnalis]KVO49590.1 hypothetical protein WT18_03305 [Burkholderia stagnalis]KVP13613.1 hypothetical protein WT20_07740 [Burkholderia stagnalis]KVW91117.1 hypothetical protein WT30_24985 [Burkholderia stagnalis]
MTQMLRSLADVQAGHSFRGSVPVVDGGNAFALQMRDLSPTGEVAWDGLVQTDVDIGKPIQWLEPGDVVFVARGARNYAVCLHEVPKSVVCSQYFFLLRVKSPALLPEFLAWQINRAPAQRYLASNAEGSDQLSIRRPILENLPISVPPLNQQQLIISLAETAVHEERQLQHLIRNRHRQMDALAFALLSDKSEQN